jgi:hypothetical protein
MGDFSIATMSTEAVDSLEAKVPGRLVQPNTGPHQRSGIISNLFVSKPDQFPALLDPVNLAVPMTAFCFRVSGPFFWASFFLLFVC